MITHKNYKREYDENFIQEYFCQFRFVEPQPRGRSLEKISYTLSKNQEKIEKSTENQKITEATEKSIKTWKNQRIKKESKNLERIKKP